MRQTDDRQDLKRSTVRKVSARTILTSWLLLAVTLSFQNCGQGFQAMEDASSFALNQPACTFNGVNLAHGASVTGYTASTVPFGSSCSAVATAVTCDKGVLSNPNAVAICTAAAANTCNFNGANIAHDASVTAYQAGMVASGMSCMSEMRKCTNGVLSGNFTYGNCSVGTPASCAFNGQTLASGTTAAGFTAPTVPFGSACTSVATTVTCNNGLISPSPAHPTCSVAQPVSCNFNGTQVAHGSQVQGYQSATVAYGQTCAPETRTCTNGSLSGSFAFANCSITPPTINFTTVPQGLAGFQGLPSNKILSVFIDGSKIYAGTDGGLAISNDNGVTFTTRTFSNGLAGNAIQDVVAYGSTVIVIAGHKLSISTDGGQTFAEDPRNLLVPDRLFLDGTTLYIATYAGLYISTDGAKTFKTLTVLNGLASNNVYDVYVVGKSIYVGTNKGLSVSNDNGQTFVTRTKANGLSSDYVTSIYATSSKIFVGTEVWGSDSGSVQTSTDNGATFSRVVPANSTQFIYNRKVISGMGSTVYISEPGGFGYILRSTDGGQEFADYSNSIYHAASDMHFSGSSGLIATSKGLLRPLDGAAGVRYQEIFNPSVFGNYHGSSSIQALAVDGDTVYVGTAGGGLAVSKDKGATFTNIALLKDFLINDIWASGQTIHLACNCAFISSTDGGQTFVINRQVQQCPETVTASGANIYIGTSNGVLSSSDGGKTFVHRKTAPIDYNIVSDIFFSAGTLYAANVNYAGLSISTDGGQTFTNRTKENGLNHNTVYAVYASGANVYAGTNEGLSISRDGGQTFTNATPNFRSSISSITEANGLLFVGTEYYGWLVSADGGRTFAYHSGNEKFSSLNVKKVVVSGRTVYIGTEAGLTRGSY